MVRAASSVARALVLREEADSAETQEVVGEIGAAVRAIEKQAGYLDDIRKFAESITSNGTKIGDRAQKMKADLERQVADLDDQVAALVRAE